MSEKVDLKKIHLFVKEQNLNESSDLRAFTHIILHIGLIVGFCLLSIISYTHEFFTLSIIFYFSFCFIHSFLGTAGISHELFHNNVFKIKLLNKFFYNIFMILTFNNPGYFSVTHNLHHKHTLSEDDPKQFLKGKITISQILFWISFDIITFLRRIRILILNAFGYIHFANKNKRRKCLNGSRLVLFSQAIISFSAIFFNQYYFLLFTLVCPFFFTLPNRLLAISQHYDFHDKDVKSNNYLENTRSLRLPLIISFLYANMNYHVEHHYVPSVPFYNLPLVQDFLIKKFSTDYRVRFFEFLPMLFNPKSQ